MTSIGIDLGTTCSCVGAVHNGEVKIFQNDQGHMITPSCVAFTDEQRLIGEPALHNLIIDPKNTIYSMKRIIGKQYDDAGVQRDINSWPFVVARDAEGKPSVKVQHNGARESFRPEEISAMVLGDMKRIAEKRLGYDVYNAVITVPSYFTHAQRAETENAARIAGLHVLRIINEPTAAAISWGRLRKGPSKRNVLVYDLGGGTFDVTVMTIDGTQFNVKSSAGNTHLGGDDFSNTLLHYLVEEIKTKYGKDVTGDEVSMNRLRVESERVKKELSFSFKERIVLPALFDRITVDIEIRRAKFIEINMHYFESTMKLMKNSLSDAKMQKFEIHDVLLVGGSTRIPHIKDMLTNYFGPGKICLSVNPDETVADGAAIYAAELSGDTIPGIGEVILSDITPLSLGINTVGDLTSVLIKRNSNLPAEAERDYTNPKDKQTIVDIEVCQGESSQFSKNEFMGGFHLPIPPMNKGQAKILVRFQLDLNGILNVTAWEKSVGNVQSIDINMKGRLNDDEIRQLRQKFERMKKEDDEYRFRQETVNRADNLIQNIRSRSNKRRVINNCNDFENWMNQNPKADRSELIRKITELELCEQNG